MRILILMFILTGCHYKFMVSKNDIINYQEGIMLIPEYNKDVYFVPLKIDTSKSVYQNVTNNILQKGFYLNSVFARDLEYIKKFGDTVMETSIIVPIKLEYREFIECNNIIKKNNSKCYNHYIRIDSNLIEIKVNIRNIQFINAVPIISENKRRKLDF